MGLLDFFRSTTGGGMVVDKYMTEARKLHKETGKPIDECVQIVIAKHKNAK